jgi:putative ABC transport system permease protein
MTSEAAIGRQLEIDFSSDFSLTVAGPVIGVVEDIHIQSLREPIQPLVYFVPAPLWGGQPIFSIASVRLTGDDLSGAVEYVRERWAELIPEIPLNTHFLESEYETLYADEARQGQLFSFFAVLTILIACLGLFGLAAFTTEQRSREIGTRKVLGATAWQIVGLLAQRILVLVLIASALAAVAAYFAVGRWLEDFAYRADINPLIFLLAAAAAAAVALFTVAAQSWRTANADPVQSLRYV